MKHYLLFVIDQEPAKDATREFHILQVKSFKNFRKDFYFLSLCARILSSIIKICDVHACLDVSGYL